MYKACIFVDTKKDADVKIICIITFSNHLHIPNSIMNCVQNRYVCKNGMVRILFIFRLFLKKNLPIVTPDPHRGSFAAQWAYLAQHRRRDPSSRRAWREKTIFLRTAQFLQLVRDQFVSQK